MAQLVNGSKKVLIGTAFVAVMTGAGGLLGVLAGVLLALLARTVLAISTGTGEFIAACAVAASLAALFLSLYMATRVPASMIRRPRVVTTTAPAAETNELAHIA